MKNLRKFLPKYFGIIEGSKNSKYLQAKNIKITFTKKSSIKNLWKKHDNIIKGINNYKKIGKKSLLDLKIELSSRIFNNCIFCEHKCRINRIKTIGKCKTKESKIASKFIHFGEEKVLIPSYTIFFSGCTFKCIFCQNWIISQNNIGNYLVPENLAKLITNNNKRGIKNINWVGGDPTPNVLYILETLNHCKLNIPQIWNSNMYCSLETMNLLNNIIDLYLTDFKYGNDKCAKKLSKIDNYSKIIKRNHKIAEKNGELIIRHLILPNHIECCSKSILNWISNNLDNVLINIMNQYYPEFNAFSNKKINRCVNNKELNDIKEYIKDLNLKQI